MWALRIGTQGFPRGLDIFKATAEKLTQEEGGNGLSSTWLQRFLNQYAALPACCASTMNLQRVLEWVEDCFHGSGDIVICTKLKEETCEI